MNRHTRLMNTPGQQDPNGAPTPEEIAARCRKIQDGWSESAERQRRTGSGKKKPYELPMVVFGRR